MSKLTHLTSTGDAHMVDVSSKNITQREALAQTRVQCSPEVIAAISSNDNPKGDVFAVARIAGIQAAKKCSDLIPLCHPLPLTKVTIDITIDANTIIIEALCKTDGKTGVEMAALTAASVSALTIYDTCKAIDKSIVITDTKLLKKTGGKSGNYQATP